MNQFAPNNQQPFKLKVPVIVLSFIALALSPLWFLLDIEFFFDTVKCTKSAKSFFTLSILVVDMIPFMAWLLYTLLPRNKPRTPILVGVALLFIVIRTVPAYVVFSILGSDHPGHFASIYIVDALILVTFIPAAIHACTGLSNKAFLIVAALVGLIAESVSLIDCSQKIGWWMFGDLYRLVWYGQYLAPIMLYAAMLLFAAANDFTPKGSTAQSSPQDVPQQMTPDTELRMIYDQLQQGIITQEEYQARRAKIIQYLH